MDESRDNPISENERSWLMAYGEPMSFEVETNPQFTIDQDELDELDGKYWKADTEPKTTSISFECNITKDEFRKLFPKPHLPRKKKKALKKLVLPTAEYFYNNGIAGRKQQFITAGHYKFWVKVNRNAVRRKFRPMWEDAREEIARIEQEYPRIKQGNNEGD